MANIVEEYKQFVEASKGLASRDMIRTPTTDKKFLEKLEDRYQIHLIGMMEMYAIRYGDPDKREKIVSFLEKQLFRNQPVKDEICHLTYDMWKDLKETILKKPEEVLSG